MINKKLKEDWLALIKINKRINKSDTPADIQEKIKIPFTPITVDIHLLYYLSQFLYPRFVNDQKNVVDIIISDYDIDNIVFEAFLYNTSRLGIYDSIETITKEIISFKQKDMDNLEQLFIKIQSTLLETNNTRIASVRFFRKRSIDLINRFYEELENYSIFEFLTHLFDFVQKLVKEELLIIYPEPNIWVFLRSLFSLFGNLKFSDIFRMIFDILPLFNQTLIFHTKELNFVLNLQKLPSQKQPNLRLALEKLELNQNPLVSNLNKNQSSKLKKEFKNHDLIVLQFESLISYLLEVSELRTPFDKEKLKLLLQKLLYAFTRIGTHWNITPRPKIYNSLVRFLMRLFGYNINLKKLSYWAIPENFYNLISTYIGLNYKIALLLTDEEKPIHLLSFACHNGVPVELIPLNHKNVIDSERITSLSSLWNSINNQYGFHALLLKIDFRMIQNLLDTFLFKFNKISLFSLLSIIRMLKQSNNFSVYPELPPFQLIKKKSSLILLKVLLDNLIDRFEF